MARVPLRMLLLATPLAMTMFAVPVAAHEMTEHGSVLVIYADQLDTGVFATLEATAPGAVPNGAFYYRIEGVQGGDHFTVTAERGQSVFVCGLAGPCQGDCPGPDWSPEGLLTGEDDPEDVWLLCNDWPDFDVKFTNGAYVNGPGDEAGTVPGDGAAVVTLFFGDPYREREASDVGEAFTYEEE